MKIKLSKTQWQSVGKQTGWMKTSDWKPEVENVGDGQTVIRQTPDRIENLRNIANYMLENCPREESPVMNKLWGYGQQLLIIANELEKKLELTKFRTVEKPKGWD